MKFNHIFMLCGLSATMLTPAVFTSCEEEDDYSVSQSAVVSQIVTGEAVPTAISATVKGTVSGLSTLSASRYQVGAIYGTSDNLELAGTRITGSLDATGAVTTELTGLTAGKTYYYATFVTLQGRVTKMGEVKSFVATDAKVATAEATSVTACKAVLNGQVSGLDEVMDAATVGFRYALSADKVAEGYSVMLSKAAGSFSASVAGLLPGTTYYYAAVSGADKNSLMGEVKTFTTAAQTMEYVDLGLSVLWAKCNIGAEAEEEAGAKGGFGDQTFFERSLSNDSYTPWNLVDDEDMVALLEIDGDSRSNSKMPTVAQYRELLEKTTASAVEVNGVKGVRFTAANGNSIFLPLAGYREGEEIISGNGFYWTNQVSLTNETYAKNLVVAADGSVSLSDTELFRALSVRTVRKPDVIAFDNSKLLVGDLEKNGRLRLEIYNEYGASKANPCIDAANFSCKKNFTVTFKLSGIDKNLKEGAPESFVAGLEYSDPTWQNAYWSELTMGKYEANVTGDGTYTVWGEFANGASGAIVFCVDIKDLMANIVDSSLVKAELVRIVPDANVDQPVVTKCVAFQNKDNNGTDGRIELYNEYGNGGTVCKGAYDSYLKFNGMCIVNFSISGVTGNLAEGAAGSYKADMSFADASWDPSYWGGAAYGTAQVTGDGTYTVYTYLNGDCEGTIVWCVELYNLWKDLVDPTKVQVSIESIQTPGKIN